MAASEDEKASAAESSMTTTIVGAIAIALGVVATLLRFYTRIHKRAGLWWDDWLALVAMLSGVAGGVFVLASSLVDPDAAWLLSVHDPSYVYTPANQLNIKIGFIANVLYFTVVAAAKASLLLMYTRIFSASLNFRAQVWVLGTAAAAFWATGTLGTIFNCWPIERSWLDGLSPAEHCIDYNVFWLATGILEETLDVFILALPVRHIMKLQLSRQKKVGVASIFLLGGFVIITGIVKAVQGWNGHPGARNPHWELTQVWASLHASIGIICASLPVCWPIISGGIGFHRLPSFSNHKLRCWWQTHRRGWAAARSRFPSKQSRGRREGLSSGTSEEALPQAMEQYNPGPEPPPGQNHHHPRVNAQVDVLFPRQVQYRWDTSRISGQEYQHSYGHVPQVGSGGGGPHAGQYYAVQGADGRVYWA